MARVALVVLAIAACQRRDAVTLDGVLDEPMWNRTAVRGVFADAGGAQARPYSEVRAVVTDDAVYLGLYAADEDIRSTDHFDVVLGDVAVTFDASGHASDRRVRAAVDRDGTLDDDRDHDEEWIVEAAVPRDALAAPPWRLEASRCDVTLARERRCGTWRGTVAP